MAKLSLDRALLKAVSYTKKGKIEEAQQLYRAILHAFPENKRAQQGFAALNKSNQSFKVQSPPQEKLNQLANLYQQGQLEAVIKQATQLIEQYPKAFIVWNIIGAANKGLGRLADASIALSKATELNPNYADGFNNLGILLQDQGRVDDAIASYAKALAIKPDYAEAHYNMGNAFKDQGESGGAVEAYKKALAIKPDYLEAHNNMGATFQEQGKLDEAIGAFTKAVSLNPNCVGAYYNMGISLKDQGRFDKAVEAYNKALAIKPDYAETYSNLGVALAGQNKLKELFMSHINTRTGFFQKNLKFLVNFKGFQCLE